MPPSQAGQIVGRGREVAELSAAVRRTLSGQGGLWLVCGEAGIGKSRLCEEVAQRAHDAGLRVSWGRCWEAGGAPAYWPWVQVLRALWHGEGKAAVPSWADAYASPLSQLLPELLTPSSERESRPSLTPDQARFLLLDGVCGALAAAAREQPLLVVLEDLHVADTASLSVLSLLLSQARVAPLMVLGTFRDAALYAAREALGQLSHQARTLMLAPLGFREVRDYLVQELGDASQAQRVYALCEGNPLFLVEAARLLRSRGEAALSGSSAAALDGGLKHLLRERLSTLSSEARSVLEVLSVIGREASRARAQALHGSDVSSAVQQAIDASLVCEWGPGHLRFTHILTRETLYHDLSPARRESLHLSLANLLEAEGASAAELAHHLRAAGEQARQRALHATLEQARVAMDTLAFDSAVEAYAAAAQALRQRPRTKPDELAPVLVQLARAELRAGAAASGRAHCVQAARLFSELGDAEGFAEAALERGSVLRFGRVDAELVAMLKEADARLGEAPGPAKARVLARLASAIQPAPNPEHSFELAHRAIEMARALDDDRLLLDVLFAASSALMDLQDARERRPINSEHAQLAEWHGDAAHALRAHTRLAFDCYDLGDLRAARASIAAVDRHAAALGHPLFGWLSVAFQSLQALYEGHLEQARAHVQRLTAMAERHPDPNFGPVLAFQRMRLARLEGNEEDFQAALSELPKLFLDGPDSGPLIRTLTAGELLYDASHERVCDLSASDIEATLRLGDRTMLLPLSQLAFRRDDRALAERLDRRLSTVTHTHCGGGVMAMTWDGPLGLARGLAAAQLGDPTRAERELEAAFRMAVSDGAEPAAARVALHWGLVFERHPAGMDRSKVVQALKEVAPLRAEPSVQFAAEKLAARLSPAGAPSAADRMPVAPPVLDFALERDGEHWRLRAGTKSHALRDTKGVRWLSTLLAEPGREWHVLTLSSDGKDPRGGDESDAGEVLDEQAIQAYRARVRELSQEIDEAEEAHDLARVEHARSEREALLAELSAAVGLGGRGRRAKSAVERARVNVQRRLKDAIGRIGELEPAVGQHLERSLRTGTFCVYDPG